jgi:chromosome segregation ATPase
MQDESKKQMEAADESFSAVMTKMATTMQQYERETARRDAMEKQVKQLNQQLEDDKNRLKNRHAAELERLRAEWEEERSTLLKMTQEECNSVFERKRMGWSKSNSTSVAGGAGFFSERLTVDTNTDAPSPGRKYASRVSTSPSTISPTFSDIESVLRQTEELVESIM